MANCIVNIDRQASLLLTHSKTFLQFMQKRNKIKAWNQYKLCRKIYVWLINHCIMWILYKIPRKKIHTPVLVTTSSLFSASVEQTNFRILSISLYPHIFMIIYFSSALGLIITYVESCWDWECCTDITDNHIICIAPSIHQERPVNITYTLWKYVQYDIVC